MKTKESALLDKHAEVKQFIDDEISITSPANVFNAVGHALKKIFRLNEIPHWAINAFALFAAIHILGIVIATVLGETSQWGNAHLYIIGVLGPLVYFSAIVSYINLVYNVLHGLRDHIVESILSIEDLNDLKIWFLEFWSIRNSLRFIVINGTLWGVAITISLNRTVGGFIGVGLTVFSLLCSLLLASVLHYLLFMLALPLRLAKYHLDTYDSNPAGSEVIQRLISILNTYIYIVAGVVAIFGIVLSQKSSAILLLWINVLTGWIPTILQFLINNYSIRKIILNAKWKTLNQLQTQINHMQKKNTAITSETTIKHINQLMDLHDRISAQPNSILNWRTGLTFLNQLLLPLLGLLIGAIDNVQKFLNIHFVP